jgi:hypothetical protein
MLIEVKPNWEYLEDLYAPMSKEKFDALSAEEQEELITDYFHEYAPRNLKIRDKDGALLPFKMNHSQLYLHWVLQVQKRKTGRNRVIMLKGRQWGGSTYTEAWFYHETTKRFGCNTFIFSHEEKSTRTLFEMVKRFHEHDDQNLRPVTGKTNAQELVFPLLDSKYEMATAGKKDAARSKRVTLLHWSEMASSPNADGHKKGLLQTVPDNDNTAIIKESTANGVGNTFHDDWLEAIKPETGWDEVAIFIPWFWHYEHKRKVPKDFVRSPQEEELAIQFGLDDEQLNFRRWKIRTMKSARSTGANREDAFKQEYPMTWQEAFLFSGANRFNASHMQVAEKHLKEPLAAYTIDTTNKPYKLIYNERGELKIWEKRIVGVPYGIGADVAKGLEHGDNSVAYIVNLNTGETAASWAGKVPSHDFGDLLEYLGKMYGKRTEIAVESTGGYGDNTIQRLIKLRYSHLFQTRKRNRDGSFEHRIGFDTTKNSKPYLIDQLDEDLIEEPHVLRDPLLWDEMSTFVRKFNETSPGQPPKLEAMDSHHDDRVIARALASMLYHIRRPKKPKTKKEKQAKETQDKDQSKRAMGRDLYRIWSRKEPKNPAAEEAKELRNMSDIKAAIKALRKDSPALSYKPKGDVAVPEPPSPKKPRKFGG